MNEIITNIKTEKNELKTVGETTYDTQIRLFNNFLKKGEKVNQNSIINYLNQQIKLKKSPSTLKIIKSSLKSGILKTFQNESNNLLFLSTIDKMFQSIKVPKQDIKIYKEKTLTESEIQKLIDNSSKRLSLIIEILATSGLRISELINIKLLDCQTIGETTYIKILGKGKKMRRIFIKKTLFDRIKKTYKSKEYLFETKNGKKYYRQYLTNEIRKKAKKILGKENIHAHTFRHSMATISLIEKGKSLTAISNYLGHSTTSITADLYINDELQPKDLLF